MQIHQLNSFAGNANQSYIAVDDGNDTGKLLINAITSPINDRIDNIIAGTAPSAEEVTDARIGSDGTIYNALGDAIRFPTGSLWEDLRAIATVKRVNENPGIAEKGYYQYSGGVVSKASNATAYGVTPVVPVSEGDVVRVITGTEMTYRGLILCIDNSMTSITYNGNEITTRHYISIDGAGYFYYETTIPSGINGVRYQYERALTGVADMMTINREMPTTYTSHDVVASVILNGSVEDSYSVLKNKKIGFLGDSFTDVNYYYGKEIQQNTGCISYNYGVQGSRFYSDNSRTSGGVTVTAEAFWKRVAPMDNDLDCIVIFGGINDASARAIFETNLGTINDVALTQAQIDSYITPTTFYQAIKTVCELVMAKYPEKKILMVIPPHVLNASYDVTLKAYLGIEQIIAAERNVADYYGIPVCDLWKNCTELNNYSGNVAIYRIGNSDDIHPNLKGQQAMTPWIQKRLESLYLSD